MFAASIALGGAAASAVGAALADWRRRRIPHSLVVALVFGWALVAATFPEALGGSPLAGLACCAGALGIGFALWAVGWLGGGDVKLAAVLGLWLGPADFGIAIVGGGFLLLAVAGTTLALGGGSRRDLPVALALAPPSVALLAFRALDVASPAPGT